MARLRTFVHVYDSDGSAHEFGPDSTLPKWAIESITNPDVWAEMPSLVTEPTPPPTAQAEPVAPKRTVRRPAVKSAA